jgi:sulfatase modifying factor 1
MRPGPSLALAAILLAPLAAAGCLLTIDDALVPDGGAPGDSGVADAPADGTHADGTPADAGAEAGCPTGMLEIPAPEAGVPFCIDSTEVTDEAYAAFLAASEPPATGSQSADCSWNTTYEPVGGPPSSDKIAVAGIDWCDAYAYCAWAKKRLCGAFGGGTLGFSGYPGHPSPSEWYAACSLGGSQAFPYGDTYEPTYCNGEPAQVGGPAVVASFPHCVGGYPGLFDMSGNVSEFLDSCAGTPDTSCGTGPECDLCLLVGGGFQSGVDGGANIDCAYANEVYRSSTYSDNGFRCCGDLP